MNELVTVQPNPVELASSATYVIYMTFITLMTIQIDVCSHTYTLLNVKNLQTANLLPSLDTSCCSNTFNCQINICCYRIVNFCLRETEVSFLFYNSLPELRISKIHTTISPILVHQTQIPCMYYSPSDGVKIPTIPHLRCYHM